MSHFKKIVVRERGNILFMKNNEKTIEVFDQKYRDLVTEVARKHGLQVEDNYETTTALYEALEAQNVKFESPHGHYVTMTINGVGVLQMLMNHKVHRDGVSMTLEYREL